MCTDLDSCSHLEPCLNGASCVNTNPNSYECICAGGYEGEDCAMETDECSATMCQNGGTCQVKKYKVETPQPTELHLYQWWFWVEQLAFHNNFRPTEMT